MGWEQALRRQFELCYSLSPNEPERPMNHTFTVTGMTCGHCEKAVTRALQQVDPLAVVHIDRANNRVQVDSTQPPEALRAAIAEEGYSVAA